MDPYSPIEYGPRVHIQGGGHIQYDTCDRSKLGLDALSLSEACREVCMQYGHTAQTITTSLISQHEEEIAPVTLEKIYTTNARILPILEYYQC